MLPENENKTNQAVDAAELGKLTRSQLKKLETKEKTAWQKVLEVITLALPVICGIVAILEYIILPNYSRNYNPYAYLYVLGIAIAAYIIYLVIGIIRKNSGNTAVYEKVHYRAPPCSPPCSCSSLCMITSPSRPVPLPSPSCPA